jgi:flagellar hook-associated protein 3 FlgL
MRISTSTMYAMGVKSIQQQQVDLMRVQQQLSSGKRILEPSDDPVAASKVLDLQQFKSMNDGFSKNILEARSALELEEAGLGSIGDLLQTAKALAVGAGNPTLSNSNRAAIGAELRGRFQELMGLANRTGANGQYLFAGYKGSTTPFVEGPAPAVVSYQGDQGRQMIQISPSRKMESSDPGSLVFKNGAVTGQNAFELIKNLADTLDGTVPFSQAIVDTALSGLDEALDTVLNVRTSVGARLNELDSTENFAANLSQQYQQVISQLQDIDYAQGISELTRNQTNLEAAQKSFMKVSGMSLFNYL